MLLSVKILLCDVKRHAAKWGKFKSRDCHSHLLWVWGSISKGLHGEFAQRAEHQKGIFLQNVRKTCSTVGSLQSLSVLTQMKEDSLTFYANSSDSSFLWCDITIHSRDEPKIWPPNFTGCCDDANKNRIQEALVWIGANMSALWTYFNMSEKDPLIVLKGCICEEFPHVRFITWNPNIPNANLNMRRTGQRKGKSLWARPRRLRPMYLKRFSSDGAKAKAPTQFYNLSAG